MIYNFESWRNAKMASFEDGRICHYHRVADCVWWEIENFLQCLVRCRIDTFSKVYAVQLSDEFCNTLLAFLEEMEFSYIHPRSTSARIKFIHSNRNSNP